MSGASESDEVLVDDSSSQSSKIGEMDEMDDAVQSVPMLYSWIFSKGQFEGRVYGSNEYKDGDRIQTSRVDWNSCTNPVEGDLIVTISKKRYRLGAPMRFIGRSTRARTDTCHYRKYMDLRERDGTASLKKRSAVGAKKRKHVAFSWPCSLEKAPLKPDVAADAPYTPEPGFFVLPKPTVVAIGSIVAHRFEKEALPRVWASGGRVLRASSKQGYYEVKYVGNRYIYLHTLCLDDYGSTGTWVLVAKTPKKPWRLDLNWSSDSSSDNSDAEDRRVTFRLRGVADNADEDHDDSQYVEEEEEQEDEYDGDGEEEEEEKEKELFRFSHRNA